MERHVAEALEAYKEKKQLKQNLESERDALGQLILKERNSNSTERYMELCHLIEVQEREINYWARRVAERTIEYIEDNQ